MCATPTELKRYRQQEDFRYWKRQQRDHIERKQPVSKAPKLKARWIKMTAMPCEKQLYIAVYIAGFLALPIIPLAMLAIRGLVPMPNVLYMIYTAGDAHVNMGWLALVTVIWLLLPLHVVITPLFVLMHYCSWYYFCCCCCKQNQRGRDDFFWIRKDLIDDYKNKGGKGDKKTVSLENLVKSKLETQEPALSRKDCKLSRKNRYGNLKHIDIEVVVDDQAKTREGEKVVAIKTESDVVLDQKMGGYLMQLAGGEVPTFDKFYVCRRNGHHEQTKEDLHSHFLVDAFVELEDMPLNPEKSMLFFKRSQSLVACCESATRDARDPHGDRCCGHLGLCGGVGYRLLRAFHTLLWSKLLLICVFFAVVFCLWLSVAVFVAPDKVLPVYTFVFTIGLFVKTNSKGFASLRTLIVKANELTSKMRFVSEGVDAIFNDEGQWLELPVN